MSRPRGAKCTITYDVTKSLFGPFVGRLPSLGRPAGPSGLSNKWELFDDWLSFSAMRHQRPRRQNGEIWRFPQLGGAAFHVRTMRARGLRLGTASGYGPGRLCAARRAPTPGLRLGLAAPARPPTPKSRFRVASVASLDRTQQCKELHVPKPETLQGGSLGVCGAPSGARKAASQNIWF